MREEYSMTQRLLREDLQVIADAIPQRSTVLDIGCFDGKLLHYLTHHKHVDGRGIDLDPNCVSACVQKGLFAIQGNADTDLIHYPDGCFDYVVSSQVLQATHRPYDVFQEMMRISGKVVVSIPNFGHWKNRLYLSLRGKMPVTKELSYQWYETPNIHFCTVKDFKELCNKLGFVIEKETYFAADKPLSLFKRLVSANFFCDKAVFLLKKS
jgi:methionine biosynthesis protein MetW